MFFFFPHRIHRWNSTNNWLSKFFFLTVQVSSHIVWCWRWTKNSFYLENLLCRCEKLCLLDNFPWDTSVVLESRLSSWVVTIINFWWDRIQVLSISGWVLHVMLEEDASCINLHCYCFSIITIIISSWNISLIISALKLRHDLWVLGLA